MKSSCAPDHRHEIPPRGALAPDANSPRHGPRARRSGLATRKPAWHRPRQPWRGHRKVGRISATPADRTSAPPAAAIVPHASSPLSDRRRPVASLKPARAPWHARPALAARRAARAHAVPDRASRVCRNSQPSSGPATLKAARGNRRLLVRANARKHRRLAALAAERELRSGIDDLGVARGSALLLVRAVLFGLRILGALANRNLILRKQDIEPAPLTAKEAVDAQPRAMLGPRVLLPQIIVEEHDAAILEQRPAQHGIRQHVGCAVRTVDIHQVERARKTAKHHSALAGIDRYPVSPGRDVGFEYVAHLAHVELERNHILGAFESVDAVDMRALAGDDVLQQPTGRPALESADFQYAKAGLGLEFVQQASPDRDVLREPILAEVHCRGTFELADAVRRVSLKRASACGGGNASRRGSSCVRRSTGRGRTPSRPRFGPAPPPNHPSPRGRFRECHRSPRSEARRWCFAPQAGSSRARSCSGRGRSRRSPRRFAGQAPLKARRAGSSTVAPSALVRPRSSAARRRRYSRRGSFGGALGAGKSERPFS